MHCNIDDCMRPASKETGGRRGMCQTHYVHWRKTGNPLVRTRYTPNEIVIDNDIATVITYDASGLAKSSFTVDAKDVDEIRQYKWALSVYGYPVTHEPETKRQLHVGRLLLKPAAHEEVDHIDRNTLNNTRINLRVCDRTTNNKNRHMKSEHNTKGVRFVANKWQAAIWYDGKNHYIGRYVKLEDAIKAYQTEHNKHFPDYTGR